MTKKSKKYKVIPTKKQLDIIKANWKIFKEIEGAFHKNIYALENKMSKETGIKDLEFFKDDMCGGDWCGVGNVSRTMKLLQREELE